MPGAVFAYNPYQPNRSSALGGRSTMGVPRTGAAESIYQRSANQTANPDNALRTTTQVNPMQKAAYDDARKYMTSLGDRTNEMVTRELGRQRDVISTGM